MVWRRPVSGTDPRPILALLMAAVSTQTAVHLILPALPVMQSVFGLSDSAISLVTTAFVAPGVVLVLFAGMAADRIGPRRVLVGSQLVFGVAGLMLLVDHRLGTLLVVRAVQGTCAATILALSISLIADFRTGTAQVAGQGYRSTALALGSGILPVVGALMLGISWYAPFALQAVNFPVALFTWWMLPPDRPVAAKPVSGRDLLRASRTPEGGALLYAGFVRFFLKTSFLSYVPILLVRQRDMSVSYAGVALGCAAISGTVAAATIGRVVARVPARWVLTIGLVGIGGSFAVLSVGVGTVVPIVGCVLYGAGDAWYGVIQNALITQAVPSRMRTSFVAGSLALRNLGKVMAPSVIAVIVLRLEVSDAFMVNAFVALISLAALYPLRHLSGSILRPRERVVLEEAP